MLQVIWCCAECRLPQIGRRLGHSDAQRSLCSYEKLSVPHRTLHCNDANTNKEPSLSDFTGVGFQGNIKLFVKLAPHQLTHTRFHSRIAQHRLHFIHNVILKYEAQRSHETYCIYCSLCMAADMSGQKADCDDDLLACVCPQGSQNSHKSQTLCCCGSDFLSGSSLEATQLIFTHSQQKDQAKLSFLHKTEGLVRLRLILTLIKATDLR